MSKQQMTVAARAVKRREAKDLARLTNERMTALEMVATEDCEHAERIRDGERDVQSTYTVRAYRLAGVAGGYVVVTHKHNTDLRAMVLWAGLFDVWQGDVKRNAIHGGRYGRDMSPVVERLRYEREVRVQAMVDGLERRVQARR